MQTWVDASYAAVHEDMKSHTGSAVSFGQGAALSKSSKQKLNTKSSTEVELVGASDYLPYPIWDKKFLEAQGYPLKENVFYQDNQSTANHAGPSPNILISGVSFRSRTNRRSALPNRTDAGRFLHQTPTGQEVFSESYRT
jgi:hypothetical protein